MSNYQYPKSQFVNWLIGNWYLLGLVIGLLVLLIMCADRLHLMPQNFPVWSGTQSRILLSSR